MGLGDSRGPWLPGRAARWRVYNGRPTVASHFHMYWPDVMQLTAVTPIATQFGTLQFDRIQVVATQVMAIELASTQLVVTKWKG